MQPFNNKKRPRSYENCGVFALYVSVCVEVVDRGLICEYKVAIAVIESAPWGGAQGENERFC